MDTRTRGFRTRAIGGLIAILVAAWLVVEVGITTTAIFAAGVIGVGITWVMIRRRRGTLASKVAGLIGAIVAGVLAVLAYGIRTLCWGNPDAAARASCETTWVAGAIVFLLIGIISLVAGFWPARDAGSSPG
jgi:hypothetical protein